MKIGKVLVRIAGFEPVERFEPDTLRAPASEEENPIQTVENRLAVLKEEMKEYGPKRGMFMLRAKVVEPSWQLESIIDTGEDREGLLQYYPGWSTDDLSKYVQGLKVLAAEAQATKFWTI
jgi:hypothetical protein